MTKKEKFLQELNEAFANSDTNYIAEQVTDDITWNVIGDFSIAGKENFIEALKKMEADEPFELKVHNIITHGDSASVEGSMKSADGKTYGFCDIYKLSGFKHPKVKGMTSYVIEIKE